MKCKMKWNFPEGGTGVFNKIPSMEEEWIFSVTTQSGKKEIYTGNDNPP